MRKNKIRRLINLNEQDGVIRSINRLQKRYNYLKSKNHKDMESRQMKYIKFHLKKLNEIHEHQLNG
jgi:hypothetical protein